MALPASRQEYISYCLRKLGAPVIQINVDSDQVEDRVDEALSFYWDYHFDGSDKCYYKAWISDNNRNDKVYSVEIDSGGTGYANGESLVFTNSSTSANSGATLSDVVGTITTDGSGVITATTLSSFGNNIAIAPQVTVTTSGGSGASLRPILGGFITLPENIHGAVRIFNLASAIQSAGVFSIQYQVAMNDLHSLSSSSMVPYYMSLMHLELVNQLLIGEQPLRYSRHKNRVYIDTDWSRFEGGMYVVIEAYEIIDPTLYTDVWKDRWLLEYGTQLIKQQWGENLKKFGGMQLPGGVSFNGQQIWDEATEKIEAMRQDLDSIMPIIHDMMG